MLKLELKYGASSLMVLAVLVGCGSDDEAAEPTPAAVHWTYEGLEGPEHWGEIDAQFATCASGEEQSPIDIPAAVAPGPLTALTFDYAGTPATITDNGHTVQVGMADESNVLSIAGEEYKLLQFHFHAHS
jgi:carbonic anhydrase